MEWVKHVEVNNMADIDLMTRIFNIKNIPERSRSYKTALNTQELKKELNKLLSNDINLLLLHEITILSFGIAVMKVESGYLYDCWDIERDKFKNGTFVPFKTD
jgi:hypothetical protein